MRKPNALCKVCSTPTYIRPSQLRKNEGRVYCSRKCACSERKTAVRICPICSESFTYTRKEQITCSRECSNKSRKGISYRKGQPFNKATKVRILKEILIQTRGPVCEECSFDKVGILQVHHMIERCKGGTNELSNLKLLCPNCHCMVHYGNN